LTERLTQQQIHDLKSTPLRCGLCNRVVREKTWEEHMESKEHQFRLELLKDKLEEKRKRYNNDELLWGGKEVEEVRKGADAPMEVNFT